MYELFCLVPGLRHDEVCSMLALSLMYMKLNFEAYLFISSQPIPSVITHSVSGYRVFRLTWYATMSTA